MKHLIRIYRSLVPQKIRVRIRCLVGRSYYVQTNHSTKTIFIHIPKTAGSSISQAIFGRMDIGHHHFLAKEYYYESAETFHSYYKFAFVRHPISRFLSAYKYFSNLPQWAKEPTRIYAATHVTPYRNINDFIDHFFSSKPTREWKHFLPQSEFVSVEGDIAMDFIGKFESLERDICQLSEILQLNVHELPHVNKSRKLKISIDNIDKQRLDRLVEYYDEDFRCFNYSP